MASLMDDEHGLSTPTSVGDSRVPGSKPVNSSSAHQERQRCGATTQQALLAQTLLLRLDSNQNHPINSPNFTHAEQYYVGIVRSVCAMVRMSCIARLHVVGQLLDTPPAFVLGEHSEDLRTTTIAWAGPLLTLIGTPRASVTISIRERVHRAFTSGTKHDRNSDRRGANGRIGDPLSSDRDPPARKLPVELL